MANYANLKAAINAVIKQNGQGEITGEVMNQVLMAMVNSLGDGYLFMGVATPYTNPEVPDQNVFYLAVQAGTYSNFNSAVVPHGITILKYGGNGWSSDNLLTFDTAPNKTSENPLTNKAITIHGSAFDISELNKVNDTLATYASLSAAIAAIPDNIKRGGMSIKFVQSSDNKYVQYLLKANSFTTDTTQWQSVNISLLQHSATTNKIGASINIGDDAYNVKDEGVRFLGNPLDWMQNQYIVDSHWDLLDLHQSIIVPIKGAKKIQWTTGANTYYTLLSDYTTPSNGDTPSFATGYSDRVYHSGTTHSIDTIPSDAKFLYIFCGYESIFSWYLPTSIKINDIELLDSTWLTNTVYKLISEDTNGYINLPFTTDKATTRLKIPFAYRKKGLVLSYTIGGEQIIEEYIADSDFTDAIWQIDSHWQSVTGHRSEYDSVLETFYQNGMLPLAQDWPVVGYFLEDGSVSFSAGFRISSYIPVNAGEKYYVAAMSDTEANRPAIVCYDSSYNIINGGLILPTENYRYKGELTIPTGTSYIRLCRRKNDAYYNFYSGVWKSIPMQEIHPDILKNFSEVNNQLYYKGQPIASGAISTLVTDLPVSNGTDIEDGYAYIDSSTYVIKVKHS